jgi:NADPH-dependent curcumin reductase CurA
MPATLLNKQVRLAARPIGLPKPTDWQVTSEPVAELGAEDVLVKTSLLSLDPAMRGWMNEGKSYIAPVGIGEVMRANGIGVVVASASPDLPVGTAVAGWLGVQEYLRVKPESLKAAGLRPVDTKLASMEKWLNALGGPGMTAYFGLLDIGQPKAGETVVVSGAAGAVGQTVGQIARIQGCRVVGIAGGAAKCEFVVKELGFDACIDYKAGGVKDGLKQHCAAGVDIYFDNVGGEILDAVLTRINRHARIIICGAVSQYNNTTPVKGPANYLSLLVNRARMEGMVVFDYAPRFGEAVKAISQWMAEGSFHSREDVIDGLESFPDTLLKLFNGENFGKLILRVAAS